MASRAECATHSPADMSLHLAPCHEPTTRCESWSFCLFHALLNFYRRPQSLLQFHSFALRRFAAALRCNCPGYSGRKKLNQGTLSSSLRAARSPERAHDNILVVAANVQWLL